MGTTFIYFLRDPETPNKGYVGKSDNPLRRLVSHLSKAKIGRNCKDNWITALKSRDLRPGLEIVDEVPFEHWQQLEAAYIEFFLERGYELVNTSPGGVGGVSGVSIRRCKREKTWTGRLYPLQKERWRLDVVKDFTTYPDYGYPEFGVQWWECIKTLRPTAVKKQEVL